MWKTANELAEDLNCSTEWIHQVYHNQGVVRDQYIIIRRPALDSDETNAKFMYKALPIDEPEDFVEAPTIRQNQKEACLIIDLAETQEKMRKYKMILDKLLQMDGAINPHLQQFIKLMIEEEEYDSLDEIF